MLRVKALMYLVTQTEHTLKTVIDKTPKIPKESNKFVDPIDVK